MHTISDVDADVAAPPLPFARYASCWRTCW